MLQRKFEKSLNFEEGRTEFLKKLRSPEEKSAHKPTMRTENLVRHTEVTTISDSNSFVYDY